MLSDARRLLPGLSVTVVPNGIDTDAFVPEGGDGGWLDDLAGLPRAAPGSLRAGLLATFARWKGHVVLLDAIAGRHAVAGRRVDRRDAALGAASAAVALGATAAVLRRARRP